MTTLGKENSYSFLELIMIRDDKQRQAELIACKANTQEEMDEANKIFQEIGNIQQQIEAIYFTLKHKNE